MGKHQRIRREKWQAATARRFMRRCIQFFILRLLFAWRIYFDEITSVPLIVFLV